jgi:hypothetical protein
VVVVAAVATGAGAGGGGVLAAVVRGRAVAGGAGGGGVLAAVVRGRAAAAAAGVGNILRRYGAEVRTVVERAGRAGGHLELFGSLFGSLEFVYSLDLGVCLELSLEAMLL